MQISWHGAASVAIESRGSRAVFDPFFPMRKSGRTDTFAELFAPDTRHIFVTHGHVDHIGSIPDIVRRKPDVTVHCTEAPARSLVLAGVPKRNISIIRPGNSVAVGALTVRAYRGRHIRFSPAVVLRTLASARIFEYADNFARLAADNARYPELGETVAYEVSDGERRVLLLGSLGLAQGESYPREPDILVLPYQGGTEKKLFDDALAAVRSIRPRRVLLDHFDDAFPPVSREIETWPFELAVAPRARAIYPAAGERYTV